MYQNIDKNKGMITMERFSKENKKYFPDDYPTAAVLEFLKLVLCNNIFIFGYTYCI